MKRKKKKKEDSQSFLFVAINRPAGVTLSSRYSCDWVAVETCLPMPLLSHLQRAINSQSSVTHRISDSKSAEADFVFQAIVSLEKKEKTNSNNFKQKKKKLNCSKKKTKNKIIK